MARYFSGITMNGSKYSISIVDDNLNIIFMDTLDIDRLINLFKRKSITVLSVDSPLALYSRHSHLISSKNTDSIRLKRRTFDKILASKGLFTYGDRFVIKKGKLDPMLNLRKELDTLGFSIKRPGECEKSIIESYSDTSFTAMGCTHSGGISSDDVIKRRIELLRDKGLRIKDYLRTDRRDVVFEINTLCQAYTAYLYYKGEATCVGTLGEGMLVVPSKNIMSDMQTSRRVQKSTKLNVADIKRHDIKDENLIESNRRSGNRGGKSKTQKVIAEYCGAQYLYTNLDGVIRINDLRPIKSYRPFTEIYQMNHIWQVQVVIGTTDGLRRVKANLIPHSENSSCFKAANEEDKRKLDSFWGNQGDKRGYLIKFNRVEVIKA